MPKLKVTCQSNQTPDVAFANVRQFLETDKDLRKLDPNFKCEFNEVKKTGTANGSQFKAKMDVISSGSSSIVTIEVDLPFHLALAKGMVQKTLEKKLSGVLS